MSLIDIAGELFAIAGAVCFGVGNVIIKSQGNKISPFGINAIRLTLSAIIYIIIVAVMGILNATFTLNWKTGLFLAGGTFIGVVVGDMIFFFSQQLIGLSRAYPIAVSYPLMTYILGMIIGAESFAWVRMVGVILVIIGVYFVSISTTTTKTEGESVLKNEESLENEMEIEESIKEAINKEIDIKDKLESKHETNLLDKPLTKKKLILGISGAAITAICWTIGTVLMDQAFELESLEGMPANAFRIVCVAPISLLIFASTNRGKYKSKFSWKGVLLVILAGIIGNTAGGLLYAFALQFSTASTTAAITAAAPLIATPLSILFLKEKISWKLIVGTIVTIGGIWLIILF